MIDKSQSVAALGRGGGLSSSVEDSLLMSCVLFMSSVEWSHRCG